MKSLLALDLATRTGFAYGPPDGTPTSGTVVFEGEIGRFLGAFETWLISFIVANEPGLVVFESPILTRTKTTPQTARRLMSLAGITQMICYQGNIRCVEANLKSVKKFFAGNGNAKKGEMIEAASRWGFPDIVWDDEADALGIWFYHVHKRAPALVQDRLLQSQMGGFRA